MKAQRVLLVIAVLATVLTVTTFASDYDDYPQGAGMHEDDDDRWENRTFRRWFDKGERRTQAYLSDPQFAEYKQECGDCHMAYPPGMLSQSSWHSMMTSLDDHFGDNAELDTDTTTSMSDYLKRHAADQQDWGYNGGRRWLNREGQLPLRISATNYFVAKHHELSPRMVTGNPEVESISRCSSCHSHAGQGSFNEDDVRIPGYGEWDD